MDKLTRYEFEATVYGGVIPIKSEDGYWFHRYEVMTEIEKLEKQNQMMLEMLKTIIEEDGFEGLPKTKQKSIQKLITKVEGKR